MIRYLKVSLLATTTLGVLIWFQWPRPSAIIPLPDDESKKGAAVFLGSTNVQLSESPSQSNEETQSPVFRRVLAYSVRTDEGLVFEFVDGIQHQYLGNWTLDKDSLGGLRFQGAEFDQQGKLLVALEADINHVWNAAQKIIEVSPRDQSARELEIPECQPGYYPYHRLTFRLAGRRCVEFNGDDEKGLIVNAYDVGSAEPIRTIEMPSRKGAVSEWRGLCAFGDMEITPDGRFLILAEAWDGEAIQTGAAIEIWDLDSDEPPIVITAPKIINDGSYTPAETSENWKWNEEESRRYPIVSRVLGHCSLRTIDSRYLKIGWAPRKKYAPGNAWQFDFFDLTVHYDLIERRFVTDKNMNERLYENVIDGPYVESVSPDGTLVWLAKFPRWELKTARLATKENVPMTDWQTFPDEVCSETADELNAWHVPGTKGVLVRASHVADNYASIPHSWLNRLDMAHLPASEWSLSDPRLYWYDFQTNHLQVLCRSGRSLRILSDRIPTDHQYAYISVYRDGQRQIEVWELPTNNPRYVLTTVAALLASLLAFVPLRSNRKTAVKVA